MNLTLSASIGFISLFGIAMLDGVVLVTSTKQLRDAGYSSEEAMIAARAADCPRC